jgi:hypothetical protein
MPRLVRAWEAGDAQELSVNGPSPFFRFSLELSRWINGVRLDKWGQTTLM